MGALPRQTKMLVAIRVGGGKKAGKMTRVTRLRIKSFLHPRRDPWPLGKGEPAYKTVLALVTANEAGQLEAICTPEAWCWRMLEIPHPNWEQRLAKVPGESREGMVKWLESHPSGLTPADKLFYKDFRQPFMEASDVILIVPFSCCIEQIFCNPSVCASWLRNGGTKHKSALRTNYVCLFG